MAFQQWNRPRIPAVRRQYGFGSQQPSTGCFGIGRQLAPDGFPLAASTAPQPTPTASGENEFCIVMQDIEGNEFYLDCGSSESVR
ncbi:hypothetical protein [Streptomyces sp. NPDC048565]|uniref:hypothetical protein n=1 Tax=Streptomyces sp. NPDC048565 TaxID=3155266 RepID=UPI003417E902